MRYRVTKVQWEQRNIVPVLLEEVADGSECCVLQVLIGERKEEQVQRAVLDVLERFAVHCSHGAAHRGQEVALVRVVKLRTELQPAVELLDVHSIDQLDCKELVPGPGGAYMVCWLSGEGEERRVAKQQAGLGRRLT